MSSPKKRLVLKLPSRLVNETLKSLKNSRPSSPKRKRSSLCKKHYLVDGSCFPSDGKKVKNAIGKEDPDQALYKCSNYVKMQKSIKLKTGDTKRVNKCVIENERELEPIFKQIGITIKRSIDERIKHHDSIEQLYLDVKERNMKIFKSIGEKNFIRAFNNVIENDDKNEGSYILRKKSKGRSVRKSGDPCPLHVWYKPATRKRRGSNDEVPAKRGTCISTDAKIFKGLIKETRDELLDRQRKTNKCPKYVWRKEDGKRGRCYSTKGKQRKVTSSPKPKKRVSFSSATKNSSNRLINRSPSRAKTPSRLTTSRSKVRTQSTPTPTPTPAFRSRVQQISNPAIKDTQLKIEKLLNTKLTNNTDINDYLGRINFLINRLKKLSITSNDPKVKNDVAQITVKYEVKLKQKMAKELDQTGYFK